MLLKTHPQFSVNIQSAADAFWKCLTTGEHWDKQMGMLRPDLAHAKYEHVEYTLEACYDQGLTTNNNLDPQSEEAQYVLREWCNRRAVVCAEKLGSLPTASCHYVEAHRMIACRPEELKSPLGIFWTHNFDDWVDPVVPWGEGGREQPAIVIKGNIFISDVDWQTSLMALMCWMIGDSESELRVKAGSPVTLIDCQWLHDGSEIILPRQKWIT